MGEELGRTTENKVIVGTKIYHLYDLAFLCSLLLVISILKKLILSKLEYESDLNCAKCTLLL